MSGCGVETLARNLPSALRADTEFSFSSRKMTGKLICMKLNRATNNQNILKQGTASLLITKICKKG